MSSTEENIKDFKTRTRQGGCRRTIGRVRGRTAKQEAAFRGSRNKCYRFKAL